MHVIAAGVGSGIETAKAVIAIVAIMIVAFWRVVLRLVLALIVIAILITVGLGAVTLAYGVRL